MFLVLLNTGNLVLDAVFYSGWLIIWLLVAMCCYNLVITLMNHVRDLLILWALIFILYIVVNLYYCTSMDDCSKLWK